MQLRTSCFNPGLFRKNITRFWPLWAAYGLLWLLLIPAGLLGEHLRRPGAVTREMVDQLVLGLGGQGGIVIAFFYGCACALAVFSYLYQHRSAVAIHSLPLRRECLFITNYLSGLTFFALPLAAVFLLTLAAELLCGAVNLGGLLVWLTAQLCYALFFYSFAVFCAMFTGNALALPPFYGILSVLANVMAWLLDGVLGAFVYGYYDSAVLARSASVLSPLVQLCRRVDFTSRWLEDTGETVYYLTGWGWIILYAVVGAALAVAALLVYRRRQVESAGDVVAVRLVRPVFKFGVAICAACSLGQMLFYIFSDSDDPLAVWWLLLCLILAGGLGYFAAQMLLSKSLRVFGRHWKGFVGFAAVTALVVVGMRLDVTGFERHVPALEQVESVTVYYSGADPRSGSLTLTEPEAIQEVLRLHEDIAGQREALRRTVHDWQNDGMGSYSYVTLPDGREVNVQERSTSSLTLTYRMRDGSSMQRNYSLPLRAADLADPDSMASRLQTLLNRPERFSTILEDCTEDTVLQVTVGWYDGVESREVFLEGEEARRVTRAAKEDIAAGRLGYTWLFYDQDRQEKLYNCYVEFLYTVPREETQPAQPWSSAVPAAEADLTGSVGITIDVAAQATAEALAQAIQAQGVDFDGFLTEWESG